ncbi:MAG: DNA repair protein RadC [Anaerovoracaceae bacterium]
MNLKQLPIEERPREKMLKQGRAALSNGELLAILIKSGTKGKSAIDIGQELLSLDKEGLIFLVDAAPEELCVISGVGEAKACQILAAIELGKRIAIRPRSENCAVTTPQEIANLFMEEMRHYPKEYFKILLINVQGKIIEETQISVGDVCSTIVHPREVFRSAVKRSAAGIICVHNHPSGNPNPSKEDLETTKRLQKTGEILGIQVLDHIIIGDGKYISLKSEGFM